MLYLVVLFTVLHISFYLYLLIGWKRVKVSKEAGKGISFTVIIPARNEESVIVGVLACLASQDYDKSDYEVIVVNDFSDDGTEKVVHECIEKFDLDLRLISLSDPNKQGKKYALTEGVAHSKFDFILTTDADCQMGPMWISSFVEKANNYEFIAGPVALKGRGLFARLQQAEFSGLLGFGAVTLEHDNPSMCSGANLGFSKKAFEVVGGYEDNINIPSGDDEFLLYNITEKFPGKASFLKNKASLVITPAHDSLQQFINQRKRWTSKWKYNKNRILRFVAIMFFLDYLFYFLFLLVCLANWDLLCYLGVIMIARFGVERLFIGSVNSFVGNRKTGLALLVLQIIYPIHVLFMGVNSIFGNYTWKGRKY